jgi:hypothetical protein
MEKMVWIQREGGLGSGPWQKRKVSDQLAQLMHQLEINPVRSDVNKPLPGKMSSQTIIVFIVTAAKTTYLIKVVPVLN